MKPIKITPYYKKRLLASVGRLLVQSGLGYIGCTICKSESDSEILKLRALIEAIEACPVKGKKK